jgi:quercetin dioxygenase-like cupin family protein
MYVVEGSLRFIVDETEHAGPAGSFVFTPIR